MKNLTQTQTEIITALEHEFMQINANATKANHSIIGELFAKANEYNTSRDAFYDDIEQNNLRVTQMRQELKSAFYDKLVSLFEPYDAKVVDESISIIEIQYKANWFYISFNVTIDDYLEYDKSNKKIHKYGRPIVQINNEEIRLDDFETRDIFKEKVTELFTC